MSKSHFKGDLKTNVPCPSRYGRLKISHCLMAMISVEHPQTKSPRVNFTLISFNMKYTWKSSRTFHWSIDVKHFTKNSHAAILPVYRLNCQTCHRQWGQMKVKTQWEEWQIKNNKSYSPKHITEKLNTIYMYMYKERQAKYGSTHANYPLYF